MRRFILLLFGFALLAAAVATLVADDSAITHLLQITTLLLLGVVIAAWVSGRFRARRGTRTPPSQIAEMERLYFRAVREMLNDNPNLVQVVNDLQRILSTDPAYKNARHFLKRAQMVQADSAATSNHNPARTRAEFMELQERLIDSDPNVRKSVVMELLQYGDIAVDPLIALLMDEDSDVRIHAATALGWVGGRDAVQPLAVALKDADPYVRRYAARALCWVVDETAIEVLVEALKDEDNYVRQYAARALGWSQDSRAVRPLLEVLNDPNADVREYANIALDDLGEPETRHQ